METPSSSYSLWRRYFLTFFGICTQENLNRLGIANHIHFTWIIRLIGTNMVSLLRTNIDEIPLLELVEARVSRTVIGSNVESDDHCILLRSYHPIPISEGVRSSAAVFRGERKGRHTGLRTGKWHLNDVWCWSLKLKEWITAIDSPASLGLGIGLLSPYKGWDIAETSKFLFLWWWMAKTVRPG